MVQEILLKVPDILQLIALGFMVLVLVATVVAKLTPTKADDEFVSRAAVLVMKAIHFLPTIGVNPKTQALEAAYADLKAQLAEKKAEIAAVETEPKAA